MVIQILFREHYNLKDLVIYILVSNMQFFPLKTKA
jgi:hypothetical protein